MKDNFDICIIGGGASGLMCAAYLYSLNSSFKVAIIERNERVGKKLLATGNGRCNFENLSCVASDYYSDDSSKLKNILEEYDVKGVLSFFENSLGVVFDNNDDLVYPITYKATTILDSLRFYLDKITTINEIVNDVKVEDELYVINGTYSCKYLVFSCGGASAPSTGSDGSLFKVVSKLAGKDSFTRIYPALVPFKTSDKDLKVLSGQRIKCKATLEDYKEEGELLFTDYGVSGILIMQLSRRYYELISAGKKPSCIDVDLFPKLSLKEKEDVVSKLLSSFPNRSEVQALTGLLNRQMAEVVLKRSGKTPSDIAFTLHNFRINIVGTLGFDNSQVTRGGLKLTYVNDNLELNNSRRCFACGELLNVDGPCGGYNLNWAWASAMKVASSIIEDINS